MVSGITGKDTLAMCRSVRAACRQTCLPRCVLHLPLCGASAISVHQVDPLLWTVTLPGGINVRKEPSLNADKTGFKLTEGQLVKVTETRGGGDDQEGEWLMLDTYSGQTGLWAKFKKGKEMYMVDPLSTCWSNTECPAGDDCGPCILKGKVQKGDPAPPSFPNLPSPQQKIEIWSKC